MTTVERGTDALMRQIAAIGPNSKAWSQLVIASRGVQGVRVLVGIKALADKYAHDELERACGTAVSHNACRLKTIRNLLKRPAPQEQLPLPFIDEHPLIRPLSDYSVDSLNAFRKERNQERRRRRVIHDTGRARGIATSTTKQRHRGLGKIFVNNSNNFDSVGCCRHLKFDFRKRSHRSSTTPNFWS
ncbi:MAG: hypothetical protein R3C49_27050 [Planctomycetaceae bacterium]